MLGERNATLTDRRAPGGTRTHTEAILSRLPLPLGYGGVRCARFHGSAPPGYFLAAGLFAGAGFETAGRGRAANSSKT